MKTLERSNVNCLFFLEKNKIIAYFIREILANKLRMAE